MHRKRRESLTIRLTDQPEYLRTGSVNNPLRFLPHTSTSFIIDRQSNPLDGFLF